MFDKFGEFDSYEEINRAAKAQLEEEDLEAIKTIAEENGLDLEDAEDFCTGAIEELTTPSLAAMGKLELEAKDLSLTGALRDWTNFIEQLCLEDEEMALAVRRKGKSLKDCMAMILKTGAVHGSIRERDASHDMLHDNPKFKGKFSVTKELITNLATGSEMKYNTSNAKTKDGKRTGCLVLNEIHAYENYDQINVFESSFGKVKHSREFIITTDGYVRDGPLDEISAMCAEILETGENLLGYFPFICEIDDMKEVDDPEAWHKANPSMEYMPILANQIMHDYLEMKKIPSKRAEFITKRMDRSARKEEETVTTWQNVLRACYEGETMEELERKIPRITLDTRGQAAVIGIDYADVRDFASAGVLTKTDDGEWIWRQHTWICADSPFIDSIKFPLRNAGQEEFEDFEVVQGPVIDVNIIADWCMKQFQDYDVKKIAMDTYRYTLFKTAFEERGLTIEDKKNPHGIVRLVRKITSATGIIAPFIQSMFSQRMVNFGPSAIMRWYTNNTSVSEDKFGNKNFGKIEPKLRKNDGFMAFDVAMFCKDELEVQIIYV